MKKLIIFTILAFSLWGHAQNGITYQAVILNPNTEELPGADNSRLPLVNQDITLEFKILNASSSLDYQETINTQTDKFGMVNVVIGTGTRKAGIATQFSTINWDGSAKNLIVSLDPSGQSTHFIEISNQPFTYVPFALYAAHTGATGTQGPAGSNGLDGKTVLNGTINPNANLGTNGDFYINTATSNLFGPKTNGDWGNGVPLVGPQGIQGPQGIAGVNGTNGSNGLSAYQIWLNAGNTGTKAQFLTALRGATGAQGAQGIQGPIGPTGATGPQGIAGTNGANGLSAYQIWLNAGNTGTEAQFLTALRGATGAQGIQGPIGATGPQGIAGTNGANGLSAYQIWLNAGNTGTEAQFLTALRGATGAQGIQGPIGATGPQGIAGTNGANGLSAYQIWLNAGNTGTEAQFLTALRGATGAQGAQGIQGPIGPTGATGPQGIAGVNGTNGSNGLSAYQIWLNAGNTGTEAQFLTALRGATGAEGPQGIQGIQGPIGLTGAQGMQGIPGTNGTNGTNGLDGKTILNGNQDPTNSSGDNGDFYINTTTNTLFGPKTSGAWGSGVALVGPQGAAGSNGKNTLVNTTTEAAGANCANGGTKIEVGLDANSNGVLDSGEVNSSLTKYVCNGVSSTNNFGTFNNFVYNDFGASSEWYGVVNTTNPGGNGQLTEFTLPLYNKSGYLKLKLNYGGFNGTGKIQIFAPNNQLLYEFLSVPNSTLEKTIGINLDQSWDSLTIKSSIVNFTSGGQFLVRKLIEEFVLFN